MTGEWHGNGMDAAWAQLVMYESAFKDSKDFSTARLRVVGTTNKGNTFT